MPPKPSRTVLPSQRLPSSLWKRNAHFGKATLLHAEFHRPLDWPAPARLSRHHSDLARLVASAAGGKALADAALRERVVRHKSVYFASGWAQYQTAKPGSFRLVPDEARLGELRQDYARMREMFFADPPNFADMMETLKLLEERINHGVSS